MRNRNEINNEKKKKQCNKIKIRNREENRKWKEKETMQWEQNEK